jgi:hypothetical protein
LLFDEIKEQLFVQLVGVAVFVRGHAKGLVQGHVSHRQIDSGENFSSNQVQISAHRQLHERVRTGPLGGDGLCDFGIHVRDIRRGTDRSIDLGGQAHTDADRGAGPVPVERDDNPAFVNPLTDHFRRQSFDIADPFHLGCDNTVSGHFYE